MKALPTATLLTATLLLGLVAACDAPKEAPATTAAPAETIVERAPTASTTAKPAVKKKSAANCSESPTVTFDEPTLEAAI